MNHPELPLPQDPHPHQLNSEVLPGAADYAETPDVIQTHGHKYPATTRGQEPLPVLVYVICGLALFLSGTSFAGFNFLYQKFDQGPGSTLIPTLDPGHDTPPPPSTAEIGKKIYSNNCVACHQANGEGNPGMYPPLVGSEYVLGSKHKLVGILLHGLGGDVTVKGGHYNGQMPAFPQTDKKLAALLTYIRMSWGNTADEVTVDDVAHAKTKLGPKNDSYKASELDLIK